MVTVLSHLVLPDIMPNQLIGLVNHVTQLVLNVLDQLTVNVFIVTVMLPLLTYKMDIVSDHKDVILDIMLLVEKVLVNLVTKPVVLVTVVITPLVPLVVTTYSTIIICVTLIAHLTCIHMFILIQIITFVKFVMKLVSLVLVQTTTNV